MKVLTEDDFFWNWKIDTITLPRIYFAETYSITEPHHKVFNIILKCNFYTVNDKIVLENGQILKVLKAPIYKSTNKWIYKVVLLGSNNLDTNYTTTSNYTIFKSNYK